MGLCNLRHVDEEIAKRKAVFERYMDRLSGTKGLILSELPKGVKGNYAYFPVVFDGYKLNRDQVFEKLRTNSIYARKYFYPLTNSFTCYQGRFDVGATPKAKYIADRVLTLPLYADLSLEDVDRICNVILS